MLQSATSTTSNPAIPTRPQSLMTERIRGEFREMPGLTLSLAQACRLWSLDEVTCREALSQLVQTGFLSRRADGGFCRD